MQSVNFNKQERDYEKEIQNFARDTLDAVEIKSKTFKKTVSHLTKASNIRK